MLSSRSWSASAARTASCYYIRFLCHHAPPPPPPPTTTETPTTTRRIVAVTTTATTSSRPSKMAAVHYLDGCSCVYVSVCCWQVPPFLSGGVQQSASAQYPFPLCLWQVKMVPRILLLVQPEMKHLGILPPCLQHSLLRSALAVQLATEHGLPLFPPCLMQCSDPFCVD